MAGLAYSGGVVMRGAQVCVDPSPCAEDGYLPGDAMNKQYFAVWKLNYHFFNPPVGPERTKCWCWTNHGPAVTALSSSGGVSLVLTASGLCSPC